MTVCSLSFKTARNFAIGETLGQASHDVLSPLGEDVRALRIDQTWRYSPRQGLKHLSQLLAVCPDLTQLSTLMHFDNVLMNDLIKFLGSAPEGFHHSLPVEDSTSATALTGELALRSLRSAETATGAIFQAGADQQHLGLALLDRGQHAFVIYRTAKNFYIAKAVKGRTQNFGSHLVAVGRQHADG